MIFLTSVRTTYNCSLERAFKTPMLCDLSKIHTGYGLVPKVTHTLKDENWGCEGASKMVYAAGSLTQKGGYGFTDTMITRSENKRWLFQLDQFQFWIMGFHKFIGEWKVTESETNSILIEYTYWLYSMNLLLYPLQWCFCKFYWKIYMKRVLHNVRTMILNDEPYIYD